MDFAVRGKNIEVTEALRDFIGKKLGRLDKYFETPPVSGAHVALSVVRGNHNVEVTIPLPGVLLRAEEESDDMYASVDLVMDKLERQIRKHKTRINRKLRQEGGLRDLFKEQDTLTNGAASEEDEDEFEIVRTKKFTLKPMNIEEAILQMNMIGHNFFVFANAENNQVNVVYRRNDGKYGLIEQE
jgi:putative sigma-54 modulation protein